MKGVGVGESDFVSSRTFEIYRDGNDHRVARLETDLDASDRRHLEDFRAVEKHRDEDNERWSTALQVRDAQRERDLQAASDQFKTGIQGIRAELQQVAEQRQKSREWTWTRFGLILTTAAALVEAYLQARHR